MRIQHNILAMNAYRNYNTNTSALAKNLEKLSSGYKINRAGDDAAGLAISEKMRAQITGLNAAQKNVKDGISLVKTAEGAMQEIQDMLNRMDYLATQSANGTYDDPVDRLNLQKEVEQLKSEINRIADSANFNGIKLLDGSLDTNIKAVEEVKEMQTVDTSVSEALTFENGKLAAVGSTLGVDTVLHNDALSEGGTEFSVDLHNFKFDASVAGNTMTMKVGDTEITLTANDDAGELTGDDLVNAFLGNNTRVDVTVSGADNKGLTSANGMKINGQSFTVEKGDKDYRLTFKQDKAPETEAQEVDGSMQVSISGKVEANLAKYSFDVGDLGTETINGVLSIGGETYTIADDGTGNAESWADVFANIKKGGGLSDFNVDIDGTKVTLTAKEAGKKAAPSVSYKPTKAGTTTAVTADAVAGADATPASCTGNAITTATLGTGEKFTVNGVEVNPNFAAGTAITTPADIGDTGYQYAINAAGKVTITAKAGTGAAQNGTVSVSINGGTAEDFTFAGGKDAVKDKVVYDVSGWNSSKLGPMTIGTDELDYDALKAAGENGLEVGTTGYVATLDGNKLVLTAKNAGQVQAGNTGPNAAPAAQPTAPTFKVWDTINEKKPTDITMTEEAKGAEGGELQGITTGAHGDFNVSTTAIKNVTAGGVDRLASTYFDLTEDMVRDGSVLTIAGVDYTFTTDKADIGKAGFVDASSGDLDTIAKNLTEAAKGNATYTVGHDGNRITLTETTANAALYTKDADGKVTYSGDYDLRTEEGIEKSLSFKGVKYQKEVVTTEGSEGGKALTLQIGDTSDSFNQLKVSVGDMHTKAMGTGKTTLDGKEIEVTKTIEEIDISNLEGAQEAIAVVKNAINYVSGVRGDLGATQNRLEHTANNLSVMAENIQDAESTIRDTDIAEEMMAYTKNNILIQSAQAMLAQANAVPQGVLQLLG